MEFTTKRGEPHNLNAVPGALAAGLPCRLPLPLGCSCCSVGAAGPGTPVLLPRGVGRAGVLARVLRVAGAAWFRSGMQAVVLPAVGPAAALGEVLAGVGF